MADETLGTLSVEITGDFSALSTAIEAAQAEATSGAQAIATALDVPDAGNALAADFQKLGEAASGATGDVDQLGATVQEASSQIDGSSAGVDSAATSVEHLGASAQEAAPELEGVAESAEHAGEGAESAEGGLEGLGEELLKMGGIALTAEGALEGIKEVLTEAIQSFAQVQTAEIALTALTGSATKAEEIIDSLKTLATSDALAFPSLVSAAQRMTAFGLSAEQIPQALNAAGNAAAATGNSFDAVSSALTRMALSGTAGARQLVQLGLSAQDLANAMGVSAGEVKAAFAAMDPSERVETIISALDKYQGVAQQTAQSIAGQWQNLKNQADFLFEAIGADIAPAVSALETFATSAVTDLKSVFDAFSNLGSSVKDALAGIASAIGVSQNDISQAMSVAGQAASAAFVEQLTFGLKGVTLVLNQTASSIRELVGLVTGQFAGMGDAMAANLAKGNAAALAYNQQLIALATSAGNFTSGLQTLNDAQTTANKAVTAAAQVLAEAKVQFDAGNISAATYTRAVQAYDSAVQASIPHGQNFAQSLAGITQAMDQAQAKYQTALATFNQVSTAFDAGKASSEVMALATKNLTDAYNALNPALQAAATGVDKIFAQTAQFRSNYQDAMSTLSDMAALFVKGQAGSQDFAIALTNAQTAAKQAGVAFQDVGTGMQAALTLVSQVAGTTEISINGKLTPSMQQLSDAATQTGIIINGKFVPALNGTGQAASSASDDFVRCADSANQTASGVQNISPAASGATTAVNSTASAVQNLNSTNTPTIQTVQALVTQLYAAADAADAATSAINSSASAEADWIQSDSGWMNSGGGKGGGKGGQSATALGAGYAGLAASAQFDAILQSFILNGSAQSAFEGSDIAGNQSNINSEIMNLEEGRPADYGLPGSPNQPTSQTGQTASWQKELNDAATAAGTLATSATSAAKSTTALSTAAVTAATPLGAIGTAASAVATPLGNLPVTIAGISTSANSTIPIMQAYGSAVSGATSATNGLAAAANNATTVQLTGSAANKQTYDDLAAVGNTLTPTLNVVKDGLNGFGDQLYTLTTISDGMINTETDTASGLADLAAAAGSATQALGSVSDAATGDSGQFQAWHDQMQSATSQASDFYTAIQKATGVVSTSEQTYDQAVATSINAQRAYSAALEAGTDTQAQLTQLLQASIAAQQAVQNLSGGSISGNIDNTTSTGTGATTARPVNPPQGQSVSSGAWEWENGAWVWDKNFAPVGGSSGPAPSPYLTQLAGLQAGSGPGSTNQYGFAGTSFQPGSAYGTPGTYSGAAPQINLTLNVNAGTVVGQNAATQLANMIQPAVVGILRQAGVKL